MIKITWTHSYGGVNTPAGVEICEDGEAPVRPFDSYLGVVEPTTLAPSDAQRAATKCRLEADRQHYLNVAYRATLDEIENKECFGLCEICGDFPHYANGPAWVAPGLRLPNGELLRLPGPVEVDLGAGLHSATPPPSKGPTVWRQGGGRDGSAVRVRLATPEEVALGQQATEAYAAHRAAVQVRLDAMEPGSNWWNGDARKWQEAWQTWLKVAVTGNRPLIIYAPSLAWDQSVLGELCPSVG